MNVSDKQITLIEKAVRICDKFFRVTMPKMNVGQSPLDAEDIRVWVEAEKTVSKAVRALHEKQ